MNSNSNSFIPIRFQKKYVFKFEFGKMIEFFRVQVRVRSPGFIYQSAGFVQETVSCNLQQHKD